MRQSGLAMKGFASDCESWHPSGGGSAIGVLGLANPGKIPLELIEVQVGSYLGEDDIVRLNDVYGRGVVACEHENSRQGMLIATLCPPLGDLPICPSFALSR